MKAFFAKYSGATHALAGVWAFLVAAYASSTAVSQAVNTAALGVYHALPHGLAVVVSAGFAIVASLWAFYRNGQKATEVTASVLPGESGTAKASASVASVVIVALISAEVPTAIALANTVISVIAAVEKNGATDTGLQAVGTTVDADLKELQTLCDQYNAAPSADALTKITGLIDQIVTQGDQALLTAADIKDPKLQAEITAALGALDTVLHVIDGYLQASQPTATVKATAARRKVKLARISAYLDRQRLETVARANGMSYEQMLRYEEALGF